MVRNLTPALFLHIQKTAGTTIVELARSAYGSHNVLSHDDYLKGINYYPQTGELKVDEKVLQGFHSMPFLSGHFGYGFAKRYMQDRYSFTFLRNPIERILSFYSFCRHRDPKEFETYQLSQQTALNEFLQMGLIDSEIKNFIWNNQVWQLACGFGDLDLQPLSSFTGIDLLELAMKHLDEFSYLGLVETFEADRDHILNDLGIVPPEDRVIFNASPSRLALPDLPQSTKDLLLELTEFDRVLYNKVWSRKLAPLKEATSTWPEVHMTSIPERLPDELQNVRNDYLELMQACLTGTIYRDTSHAPFGLKIFDPYLREQGLDWPSHAETMIGEKRLANLRMLIETVIADDVPGELIETGVWRGGACIFMRAILYAHSVSDRSVWVADSFEGLPRANESQYPADAGSNFHSYAQLAVSLEQVQENFRAYGLLDEQVKFLKGWFKDTLPTAPIGQLALIRLDGDMYESTMDSLTHLYPKLSQRGYVIIDDYHVVPACKAAVTDYCSKHGIEPNIVEIDGVGVYWRKSEVSESSGGRIQRNQTGVSADLQISRLSRGVIGMSRRVFARLNESLTEQDKSLKERDERITRLNRFLLERDAQITSLNQLVADRDAKLASVFSSTSWKVTKPLRTVKEFIGSKGSGQKSS